MPGQQLPLLAPIRWHGPAHDLLDAAHCQARLSFASPPLQAEPLPSGTTSGPAPHAAPPPPPPPALPLSEAEVLAGMDQQRLWHSAQSFARGVLAELRCDAGQTERVGWWCCECLRVAGCVCLKGGGGGGTKGQKWSHLYTSCDRK
jgi:hypothetical protein